MKKKRALGEGLAAPAVDFVLAARAQHKAAVDRKKSVLIKPDLAVDKNPLAMASSDPLAADTVGTTIMGFDPGRIPYLRAMAEAGMGQGDSKKIRVVGAPLDECRFEFKAHKKMAEVYQSTQGIAEGRGPEEGP